MNAEEPNGAKINITDNSSPIILTEILQTQAYILALTDVLLTDEQVDKFNGKVKEHFSALSKSVFVNHPDLNK